MKQKSIKYRSLAEANLLAQKSQFAPNDFNAFPPRICQSSNSSKTHHRFFKFHLNFPPSFSSAHFSVSLFRFVSESCSPASNVLFISNLVNGTRRTRPISPACTVRWPNLGFELHAFIGPRWWSQPHLQLRWVVLDIAWAIGQCKLLFFRFIFFLFCIQKMVLLVLEACCIDCRLKVILFWIDSSISSAY